MSKFESEQAEALYEREAHDQVGSSTEGIGWAGLYLSPWEEDSNIVAAVLMEATDGSVTMFQYETEESMREAWGNFERSLDVSHPNVHEENVIWCLGEGEGCLWTVPVWSPPGQEGTSFPPLWGGYAPDLNTAVNMMRDLIGDEHQGEEYWRYEGGRFYLTDLF
jgi:hypothetical protein